VTGTFCEETFLLHIAPAILIESRAANDHRRTREEFPVPFDEPQSHVRPVGFNAPQQPPKSGLPSNFVANRKMTIIIAAVDSAVTKSMLRTVGVSLFAKSK